jgi:predicted RNA-binding protein YlxR (DUF448 family)
MRLVRVAVGASGLVVVDLRRRQGGRGAYLHRRRSCWESFVRGRPYVRSLRRAVSRSERLALVAALREMSEQAVHVGGDIGDPMAHAGITGDA